MRRSGASRFFSAKSGIVVIIQTAFANLAVQVVNPAVWHSCGA